MRQLRFHGTGVQFGWLGARSQEWLSKNLITLREWRSELMWLCLSCAPACGAARSARSAASVRVARMGFSFRAVSPAGARVGWRGSLCLLAGREGGAGDAALLRVVCGVLEVKLRR